MAEWLRRWIANPLSSGCVSSNLIDVVTILLFRITKRCEGTTVDFLYVLMIDVVIVEALFFNCRQTGLKD